MKCESEVRQLLIDNAIHLIADGGFERATTKELTFCGGAPQSFKMNEIYIYRLFGSKEGLYGQAFLCLDRELFGIIRSGARLADEADKDTREKLYEIFITAWNFITNNEERCRYYVRYYHSGYFKGKAQEQHRKLFEEVIAKLVPLFREDADVFSLLHCVFTAMFDFAVRVYNGELKNSEENKTHIFHVLYCIIADYFQDCAAKPERPVT